VGDPLIVERTDELPESTSDDRLSDGAIAGIVLCAVFFVLLLAYMCMRYGRHTDKVQAVTSDVDLDHEMSLDVIYPDSTAGAFAA
jgi:hypothetical protein